MNKTKELTQASLLTAIFIVVTIISVGSGIGYGVYLDYIVPLFYFIIYLKCGSKYTLLSAISGLTIVFAILGNPGTAIWASQGIILGIMCGILSEKKTTIIDDLLLGTVIGTIIIIFVDIYASKLIGYSFITDFKETTSYMAKMIMKNVPEFNKYPAEFIKSYFETVFYLSITLIPLGTVVGVYIVGLFVGNRINVLKGESKKKYDMIRHFRTYSRLVYCSRNLFYIMTIYAMTFMLLNKYKISTNIAYIDTIMHCFFYTSMYFLIRDSIAGIQGYMLMRGKSMSNVRLFTIVYLFILLSYFWIASAISILFFMTLDSKYGLREEYIKKIDMLLTK
ncbi:hypothetical protein [Peptacetobacter sp.]|uniref:hypothetical protein n=1 Tax=Peptacetobacter sp. TaxID=2991975 RepID=UPI002604B4E0|nr:hypothetical protein [Peptacetobacter sp.]